MALLSDPARRVLLVAYFHPPIPFLGGDPWSALVKELRKLGHEVTIVTTRGYGDLPTDAEQGVVRTLDLTSVDVLRRLLRRPTVAREGEASAVWKRPPPILTRVIVPDAHLVGWAAWAVPTVRRLIRQRAVECVITTSPPDSTHLIGLSLGRDRPAWIADFRDGWTFEPLREPFLTEPQRRLDGWLETRVVRHADQVIAPTSVFIDDFRSRFGREGGVVPNAWDTDLEPEVARATPPALATDRVNLVYTGTLGGLRGHDDRALLEALRWIVREDRNTASRLRLVIAGRLMDDEAMVLRAPDIQPIIEIAGALPRPEALALQRHADALLLITSEHKSVAHGKLFEYLAAGRPILTLASDNEPARIVRATQTGEVVPHDDVGAIVAALRRVADRSLGFAPCDVERYTYRVAAQQLATEIEGAIARRARRIGGEPPLRRRSAG